LKINLDEDELFHYKIIIEDSGSNAEELNYKNSKSSNKKCMLEGKNNK